MKVIIIRPSKINWVVLIGNTNQPTNQPTENHHPEDKGRYFQEIKLDLMKYIGRMLYFNKDKFAKLYYSDMVDW